jgi:hypothetical protein
MTGRREPRWADWSDDELLDQVVEELRERGVRFRPHVWFSEEWFTPDGVPGIALPFYLAHPRLARLEFKQVLEVEGGSREDCLRILRHELGHAVDNAYRLRGRKRRRDIFGDPERRYPKTYSPRPFSRYYVLHLDAWYAQSHPDEDFAETFAVWLGSSGSWRQRYAGWPALHKLEYMDSLMRSLAGRKPDVGPRLRVEPVAALEHTLREHYEEKRSRYAYDAPGVYDRDLKRLFTSEPTAKKRMSAAAFLERNRPRLRGIVARYTGLHAYTVDQILNGIAFRCRELRLQLAGPEAGALIDAVALLTVHTMHNVQKGRQQFAL